MNSQTPFFTKQINLGVCHSQLDPSNISMKLFYRTNEDKQELIKYWLYIQGLNIKAGHEVFKY